MPQDYSDLQVVTEEVPKYPVVPGKEAAPAYYPANKVATSVNAYPADDSETGEGQNGRKRICGLASRTFWIILAVPVVIAVAAAVGGGVGATLSNKKSVATPAITAAFSAVDSATSPTSISTSTQSSTSSQSIQPATRTTQSSVTLTTSTVVGSSGTLLVDCPSSNDTVYTPSSSTQRFRKSCGKALVNAQSDAALVTGQVFTLDSCIDQCAAYNQQYASDIAAGAKSICNAACWRSTGGDLGGWCYGYLTKNVTISDASTFNFNSEVRCNSAALISQ